MFISSKFARVAALLLGAATMPFVHATTYWTNSITSGASMATAFGPNYQSDFGASRAFVNTQPALQISMPGGVNAGLGQDPWSPSDYGLSFYTQPFGIGVGKEVLELFYSVYIYPTFNYTLGGVLPGLMSRPGCNTGMPADDCFSVNLMFNGEDWGSLSAYVHAHPDNQAVNCFTPDGELSRSNYCHMDGYGVGMFEAEPLIFEAGIWNHVNIRLEMNTPGLADGVLNVTVNGVSAYADTIVYRDSSSVKIVGMDHKVFYGTSAPYGNDTIADDSYAPVLGDTMLINSHKLFD